MTNAIVRKSRMLALFERKYCEIIPESPNVPCSLHFRCDLLGCAKFCGDYLLPRLIAVWIIPQQNQFHFWLAPLRFVSVTLISFAMNYGRDSRPWASTSTEMNAAANLADGYR
jgi:hypothetical protein